MKVIVCGGRDFTNWQFLFREMDRLHRARLITLVIEGGQRSRDRNGTIIGGADYWANRWACSRGIEVAQENADWRDISYHDAVIRTNSRGDKYDANAGPRRNELMITKYRPEAVITFPGGRGTTDMASRAYEHGLEIIMVQP